MAERWKRKWVPEKGGPGGGIASSSREALLSEWGERCRPSGVQTWLPGAAGALGAPGHPAPGKGTQKGGGRRPHRARSSAGDGGFALRGSPRKP